MSKKLLQVSCLRTTVFKRFILKKNSSRRHVLTLMAGTALSQAIPVGISPILTRLYTPSDFGLFAIFLSITSTFAVVANGRYEMALMLPADEDDAINIAALSLVFATILALCVLIFVIFFHADIGMWLNNTEIEAWLFLTPISIWLAGIFNVLNYLNNRQKQYGDIATSTVLKSVVAAALQLTLGLFKAGASGLILGQMVSNLAANTKLYRNAVKGRNVQSIVSVQRMLGMAIKYKEFPIYSLPSALANVLSVNALNVMISSVYSVVNVGYFALSQRVLGAPLLLVGGAISQVFFKTASDEYQKTGVAEIAFRRNAMRLLGISIIGFCASYFLIEDLFSFVFGQKWRVAGEFAKIMLPLFFVRFVVSPLTPLAQIMDRKKGVWVNVALLLNAFVVLGLCEYFSLPIKRCLVFLSTSMSLIYVLFFIQLYYISRGRFVK